MRTASKDRTTPTSSSSGRRTPSGGTFAARPASPKVVVAVDKKLNESKSAPSPKQQFSRSLNHKSPSNIAEANFLAMHERPGVRKGYNSSSYYDNLTRHEDTDFEHASVQTQSTFNDSQLAKIKEVVDSQKKRETYIDNDHDQYNSSDHRQFSSVPAPRGRVDHDLNDSHLSEYGANDNLTRSYVDDSRDDCAVSDITQEAHYMTINEANCKPWRNNQSGSNYNAMSSSASVYTTSANLEPSSLPDDEIENMMRILAEEKARRAHMNLSTTNGGNLSTAEAAAVRKNVKRSKSGGNEAMMTTKKSNTSDSHRQGPPTSLPSFHTFKQQVLEAASEAPVDREVERFFQGHQHSSVPQPAQSTSPFIHGPLNNAPHHSLGGGNGISPAGVTGAPMSRGTTLSRGSGAYVPAEKMWANGDSNPQYSPTHSSPLVYVESPSTIAGMTSTLNSSGRLSAAPLSESRNGAPFTPRINNLMNGSGEIEGDVHVRTSNSANTPTHKMRDLLRDAKQYGHQQYPEDVPQPAAIRHHVVHVEQFTPLDAVLHNAAQRDRAPHASSGGHHHHHHGHHSSKGDAPPLKIVRPMTRSISIGSDASSVDGLNLQHHHQHSAAAVGGNRGQDTKFFDNLLHREPTNRELLVSPLCAFDDCASLGSFSLNSGSRRSNTSSKHHTHKSHTVHKSASDKSPHYLQATSSSAKNHVSPMSKKH